jgi:CheY-like chemotaxis protein
VDDSADTLEMLADLLRLEGHQVRTAHDGPEALRAAQEFAADVVLLDIGLPGMDGFEVARRLRQLPALAGAVLVAVTGYGRAADRLRGAEVGFNHYLIKPLSPAALEGVLGGPAALAPSPAPPG